MSELGRISFGYDEVEVSKKRRGEELSLVRERTLMMSVPEGIRKVYVDVSGVEDVKNGVTFLGRPTQASACLEVVADERGIEEVDGYVLVRDWAILDWKENE